MRSERVYMPRLVFVAALAVLAAVLLLLAGGCAPTGVYHIVEPGQTLYRIAKTYDIDAARLAKVNGINDPTKLETGQRLFIPGASVPRSVRAPEPGKPSPPLIETKKQAEKSAPTAPRPETKPPPDKVAKTPPESMPPPGTFAWPVRGKIVSDFGATAGKPNKGIEIAVPQGTPVVAAAAGKVIYSGSGIRGYGNLVILEHGEGYYTVYGYNKRNLVAVNSFVGQGQQIALSGAPADDKSPRLHFEIRKGKTAVNPIFFLP
jgi:lipoprotein NlpD